MRIDGRSPDELRPIKIEPHISAHAEGSALIHFGRTQVLCTASFEPVAPKWLQGSGQGWVTAEYGMLPRSTQTRIKRDKAASGGRTQEISRLIGRSLRAACDLSKMQEKQILIDCDVLQADGGTRTAAITGGFVALALAMQKLTAVGEFKELPLVQYVSAISIGLKGKELLLDLNYDEDSTISTDMNFVMTGEEKFVEIQGTAEGQAFSSEELMQMTLLATRACRQLFGEQSRLIKDFFSYQDQQGL